VSNIILVTLLFFQVTKIMLIVIWKPTLIQLQIVNLSTSFIVVVMSYLLVELDICLVSCGWKKSLGKEHFQQRILMNSANVSWNRDENMLNDIEVRVLWCIPITMWSILVSRYMLYISYQLVWNEKRHSIHSIFSLDSGEGFEVILFFFYLHL